MADRRLERNLDAAVQRDEEDHVQRMLDAALEQTFPASDPIAIGAEKLRSQADHRVERPPEPQDRPGEGDNSEPHNATSK